MEYLLLIYSDESTGPRCEDTNDNAAYESILAEYDAYADEVQKADVMLGANPLESIVTATTVRVREGKTDTIDGPFAETKEQLAGYFLLDCKDKDEAIAWAAKIPGARWGSVEVRPIMKFN